MLILEFELELLEGFELFEGVVEEVVRLLSGARLFGCFGSMVELELGLVGILLSLFGLLLVIEIGCGLGEERVEEDCK